MSVENDASDGLLVLRGSNRYFQPSIAKVAFPEKALLRNYTYRLVQMLAPHVDERVIKGSRQPDELSGLDALLPFAQRLDLRIGAGPRTSSADPLPEKIRR
jgi:hypothetical protein